MMVDVTEGFIHLPGTISSKNPRVSCLNLVIHTHLEVMAILGLANSIPKAKSLKP